MPEYKIKYAGMWDVYCDGFYGEGEEWRWERSFKTFEDAAKWLYDECGYQVEVFVS